MSPVEFGMCCVVVGGVSFPVHSHSESQTAGAYLGGNLSTLVELKLSMTETKVTRVLFAVILFCLLSPSVIHLQLWVRRHAMCIGVVKM